VRVTDERSGANLDQVRVELVLFPDEIVQQTFTDSSGRASFLNMQINKYIIRTDARGFEPTQVEIEPFRGQRTFQVSIQMRSLDAAPKEQGGKISARELSIPESARNEFSKGVDFLNQKKDPEQSIKHFQNAIDAYPTYYEAYFLIGMAYLQAKQPKEAQSALQKAVELNPKFLDPYFPLSELLIAGKQFDKAVPLLVAADQQDARNWRWPYQLAMCYAKQGMWDKALNYGQTALARPDPPTKVHLLIADIYSNSGNPAKAVAELEEFEKLDPKSPYVARIDQVLPELRRQAAAARAANSPQP
jgi:tetratricopeptide (TPR) repeat protein